MHYSVANYCNSAQVTRDWSCKVRVSPALGLLEPKNNFWGLVDRCGDDHSFGNDNNSQLNKIGNGFDRKTGTGYFVGYNDQQKKIVISFKGTDSIRSAFVDIQLAFADASNVSPAFSNGEKIHTGFMNAYKYHKNSVQSALLMAIQDRPSYPITFTGHSLGGAMSSIAALDFVTSTKGAKYKDQVRIISFGAPRVGNTAWATLSQKMIPTQYRIAHENDVVPSLPPRAFGYFHTGQQVELTGKFTWGIRSYSTSMCDIGAISNTGESLDCAGKFDNDLLVRIMEDIKNGGEFDFGLLLNFGAMAGSELIGGLLNHITNYLSFFTYPAIFPLTMSTSC
jgi:hypothetical protein